MSGLCELERQGALGVNQEPAARAGEDGPALLGRGCHSVVSSKECQAAPGLGEQGQRCHGWMGRFAEHVPCSASLILWVLVLESL